jgi:hypothetical protein
MSHEQIIVEYLAGPRKLHAAVTGMTAEQMDATPIPGEWSTKRVICHIADFEPVYADRMKRVIAENEPMMMNGDPDLFAARLAYDQRDGLSEAFRQPSFSGFRLSGFQTAKFRGLSDSQVSRAFGFQAFRQPSFSGFRLSGFQTAKFLGLSDSQVSRAFGFQAFRQPSFSGFRLSDSQVSRGFQTAKFLVRPRS